MLLESIYLALGLDAADAAKDAGEALAHGMRSVSSIMSLLAGGPPLDAAAPPEPASTATRAISDMDRLVGERFALQGSPLDEYDGVIVHRALDLWTDANVILKSWKVDDEGREIGAWRAEVDLLTRLKGSGHHAPLILHGVTDGEAWLVRGRIASSLPEYVGDAEFDSDDDRVGDLLVVFDALLAAVAELTQLVDHCSINPAAVLLDHELRCHLIDFDAGVSASRVAIPALLNRDKRRARYQAPEVRGGHVIRHGAADVYSCAAVLIWLFTGNGPCASPRLDLDSMDLFLAEPLRGTLVRMLSDIPALRPAVEDVREELAQVLP